MRQEIENSIGWWGLACAGILMVGVLFLINGAQDNVGHALGMALMVIGVMVGVVTLFTVLILSLSDDTDCGP